MQVVRAAVISLSKEELRKILPSYGPPRLPSPANAKELEALRQQLRDAQHAFSSENTRLEVLQQALVRSHAERLAAAEAVDEAETALRTAKQFGRHNLALAYLDGREVGELTPQSAEAQRDVAADNYATCRGDRARPARGNCELGERRRARDAALSALVCRSPEFLHLLRRQSAQWAKLRSLRLAVLAIAGELGGQIDMRLLTIAQNDEPLERLTGYKVGDALIERWTGSVKALRDDAEAKLPNGRGDGPISTSCTNRCGHGAANYHSLWYVPSAKKFFGGMHA